MATLYNQPLAHRFGKTLQDALDSGKWTSLDIAVAWVRRSGMKHVLVPLQAFLRTGGAVRFTVGVDIENTSKEGLEDLLSLTAYGTAELYVYHNEEQVTFHPKMYLFSNASQARLVVGSNNLTEAGLFANTEAGLEIETGIDDPVIEQARAALATWRDTASGLTRRLDTVLLKDLEDLGYILSETVLRTRRTASRRSVKSVRERRLLFARRKITVPAPPGPPLPPRARGRNIAKQYGGATDGPGSIGRVLLMRARKGRGATQVQIPLRVYYGTTFFGGATEMTSAHDGRVHGISPSMSKGKVNTMKVDIPEVGPMADPVLRLESTLGGVVYEAYDAHSILGRPVIDALERGRQLAPPATVLTKPSDPAHSTWYRFI